MKFLIALGISLSICMAAVGQEDKIDWDATYQALVKSQPEILEKVKSGKASKDDIIQWMKSDTGIEYVKEIVDLVMVEEKKIASKKTASKKTASKKTASKKTATKNTGEPNVDAFIKKLAEMVESGALTKPQATELYQSLLGKGKKGSTKNSSPKDSASKKTNGKRFFGMTKDELIQAMKKKGMSDDEINEWLKENVDYKSKGSADFKKGDYKKKGDFKKGVNGRDYKVSSLEQQKELSKILPKTSTGDDKEGPVACGFFGWAADATHRFMDNSHKGKPRTIHGLSFRLDYRDHDTIGRSWKNITIKVAHGDWDSIEYNTSRKFKLTDEQKVVFNKEWSFPTLKGFPALKPAEWGGPQNCLNFRFDEPFEYNGKDAIYIEFEFNGGETVDKREWDGDLPYGFEYFLDSMPEAGGWRMAEKPRGIYRAPRVEAAVSYTAGGQSVWTSSAKGMPYLKWDFKSQK